jgi:ankyrin repeat protein
MISLQLTAVVAVLLSLGTARAEYRTVLFRLETNKENKTRVTVYSDDKQDRKTGISVENAGQTVHTAADREARRAEPGPENPDEFQAALVAALHLFAREGELDHLRAVLDKYPKLVNARQSFRQPRKPVRTDDFTALHHAAERGRERVVSYLIEKGADVNVADPLGWTPLHLAAQQRHLGVIKLLVKAGAKVEARTVAIPAQPPVGPPDVGPDGKSPLLQKVVAFPALTPLELAQAAKHTAVIEYLKSVGK